MDQNQDASNRSNRKMRQEIILIDDTGTSAHDPICIDDTSTSGDDFNENASDEEPEKVGRASVDEDSSDESVDSDLDEYASDEEPEEAESVPPPNKRRRVSKTAKSDVSSHSQLTSPPSLLPDCFYPYLKSLPDLHGKACEKTMKALVYFIGEEVNAEALLGLVKQAKPRYGISDIMVGINDIIAKARKKSQCHLTVHSGDDVQAYLGPSRVCLLMCSDYVPIKDKLMLLRWKVVLAAKLGLETIKSKCAARAPSFVYASMGNGMSDKNDLVEVLAWALQMRPKPRIVIEGKAAPSHDRSKRLKDLEDKLGVRFFQLDIPVGDGGPPVSTSFLISDRYVYESLCGFYCEHEHKQNSFNRCDIAEIIAHKVSANCHQESSRVEPPKSRQLNRRMTDCENKLDGVSPKSLQNLEKQKYRKSDEKLCTNGEYTHNSEDLQPMEGSRVRKYIGMKYYHGKVVGEDTIDVDGELVKGWIVKYEDGDGEDFEDHDFVQCCQNRPLVPCAAIGRPFRFCELFCGSGVVSHYFRQSFFKVMSIDCDPKPNATHIMDVRELQCDPIDLRVTKHLGGVPDFIWASPPCRTYTYLAGNKHRVPQEGIWNKSEASNEDDSKLLAMFKFMQAAKEVNPHLIVVIENPVGFMDMSPLMIRFKEDLGLHTARVNYCAFGRDEKKPTHLWTNDVDLAQLMSKHTCENYCPVSDENGKQCGRKHKSSVKERKDLCHEVIPEPLALRVATHATSRFEKDCIRHYP